MRRRGKNRLKARNGYCDNTVKPNRQRVIIKGKILPVPIDSFQNLTERYHCSSLILSVTMDPRARVTHRDSSAWYSHIDGRYVLCFHLHCFRLVKFLSAVSRYYCYITHRHREDPGIGHIGVISVYMDGLGLFENSKTRMDWAKGELSSASSI